MWYNKDWDKGLVKRRAVDDIKYAISAVERIYGKLDETFVDEIDETVKDLDGFIAELEKDVDEKRVSDILKKVDDAKQKIDSVLDIADVDAEQFDREIDNAKLWIERLIKD